MTIPNENLEKAKWLSSILVQKLWPDYLLYTNDLTRAETIFAYMRANKKKWETPMKTLIKNAVSQAWMRWQQSIDPYELFIDAGVYNNEMTLHDFISI